MAEAKLGPKRDFANRFMSDKTAFEILGGNKKGMLTIIKEITVASKKGDVRRGVLCQCDCGKMVERQLHPLKWTETPSCGCKRKLPNGRARHGDASNGKVTGEYRSWHGAKSRCYKADHKNYDNYGGRGITMCDRWLNSYENFLEDMGRRPDPEWSLDRIDVNGNYCPENCRWASAKTQSINRRNTVWITVAGKTMTATDFYIATGLCTFSTREKFKSGMTGDEVVAASIEALEKLRNP